jgi:hypothetical protein
LIKWGTAHSLFHKELFHKCIWHFAHQIEFAKPNEWDDDGLMFSLIHSPHLPDDYHGQMDIIIDGKLLRFKKDCDV